MFRAAGDQETTTAGGNMKQHDDRPHPPRGTTTHLSPLEMRCALRSSIILVADPKICRCVAAVDDTRDASASSVCCLRPPQRKEITVVLYRIMIVALSWQSPYKSGAPDSCTEDCLGSGCLRPYPCVLSSSQLLLALPPR